MWPVAQLRTDRRPARVHPPEQLERLAAAIEEFGFVAPLLVRRDLVVIAGRARLAAARALGLERVPVVVLEHLADDQAEALAIADNRLAELGGWDLELLGGELAALQAAGVPADVLGFSDAELEGLADQLAAVVAELETEEAG